MDSATANNLVGEVKVQGEPEIAPLMRQALMEHLEALDDPVATLVEASPPKRVLLLYADKIVTIGVDDHPKASLQAEVRSLRNAVVSLETHIEGSPHERTLARVSAWRFVFPDGDSVALSGRVPAGGAPNDSEEFARAVAGNVGRRLAGP